LIVPELCDVQVAPALEVVMIVLAFMGPPLDEPQPTATQ
jgi:hypothetical protein